MWQTQKGATFFPNRRFGPKPELQGDPVRSGLALSYVSPSRSSHLGVHLRECWSQLVGLPSEDDGLRAGVQRRHLHRHPCSLQDLLQSVALWTYDVLMLRLLHLHGDGGGLPLL